MITSAIQSAFERAKDQKWWELYVAVDIHGTIFPSTHDLATQKEFFPGAKEALQYLSKRPDIKLFLYSCSTTHQYFKIVTLLHEHDITIHGIGSVQVDHLEDPVLVDAKYKTKPYYNLLLDDKAGFETSDWPKVLAEFKKYPTLTKKI